MRVLVRPLLLFGVLCGFTTHGQSHVSVAPAINTLVWTNGFPKSLVGGVDVSVDLGPAAGWKCTNVTILVVDAATNKTLDSYEVDDPAGLVVAKTFTGLKSNLKVRVTAEATYENAGTFEPKQIQTTVTTK